MARYILIDHYSGYIFADSAEFIGVDPDQEITPTYAAQYLDETLGNPSHEYELLPSNPRDASGYDVYRADINGSEAVPAVTDGQDQSVIDAVLRDCEYVGFIKVLTVE